MVVDYQSCACLQGVLPVARLRSEAQRTEQHEYQQSVSFLHIRFVFGDYLYKKTVIAEILHLKELKKHKTHALFTPGILAGIN